MTLGLLAVAHSFWLVGILLVVWGATNSAIPVAWSTWLSREIADEPESGGGLMVAAIQLSIMLGAAGGGWLLDHLSIAGTLIAAALALGVSAMFVGNGLRLQHSKMTPSSAPKIRARRLRAGPEASRSRTAAPRSIEGRRAV